MDGCLVKLVLALGKMQISLNGSVRKQAGRQKTSCYAQFFHAFQIICVAILFFNAPKSYSAPNFDTQIPVSFFTNVASKLVAAELAVNVTQLQVYPTNQYTPSLHRLLQVTANIYQATTTNAFSPVFRPLFSSDDTGTKIFITGYQQVISVSGIGDPQLSLPVEASRLANQQKPFTNLAINVYGVPWIIGVKKGLPSFNQFYQRNTFQITRKLQVTRNDPSIPGALATNQMFIMSITNRLGFSFWNSYSNDYIPTSGNLTICFHDTLRMVLTNERNSWETNSYFAFATNLSVWPGAAWTISQPPTQYPSPNSFVSGVWDYPFLPASEYLFSSGNFVPISNLSWESRVGVPLLPNFGLMTTNWVQAFILDGTNVIDYVQLDGPSSRRNLDSEIADTDFIGTPPPMWSTNGYGNSIIPTWGVVNQLWVSRYNPSGTINIFWRNAANMPPGINTPSIEAAYFNAFFIGGGVVGPNGQFYVNTNLSQQAPYSPSRSSWEYSSWQANDPLVHFLLTDLNCITYSTGINRADDLTTANYPNPNLNSLGEHYQPWGRNVQMGQFATVDSSAYNSRLRDPLVWKSDAWNFPIGQSWSLNWLGRVHRGTPWQTIYLKDTDVLQETNATGDNIGTNTWRTWTGVSSTQDTKLTSPVSDWHLAGLLAAILNTNDLIQQFSVNNPNASAWAGLIDGFDALTNTTVLPSSFKTPNFDNLVITSNSPQANTIVNAIQQMQASQTIREIGEVLSVPELTTKSPFLNWNDTDQQKYGITDEVYEMIPSELLPLLRADSIGTMTSDNGQRRIRFTGYDDHPYAIEASTNLFNWSAISTNFPVNGILETSPSPSGPQQFFRSVLLQ